MSCAKATPSSRQTIPLRLPLAKTPSRPNPAPETVAEGYPPPDITLPSDVTESPAKYYIKGKPVTVLAERVEYLDDHDTLVTESLRDYSRKAIRQHYASLDDFLHRGQAAERKEAVLEELVAAGLLIDPLREDVGTDLNPSDLICHIAFDSCPLTRSERANNMGRGNVFSRYSLQARIVLEALLGAFLIF